MGVLFNSKGLSGRYDRVVQRLAALATSLLRTADVKKAEAPINALLATSRALEGDQVAFMGDDGKPAAVSCAKGWELGVACDVVGEPRLCIKADRFADEAVAIDLSTTQAVALAAWLVNRIWDQLEFDALEPDEKVELREMCDTFGRFFNAIDGTTDKIRDEQSRVHRRAYEAKHFASLGGLEMAAEARVRKEYESTVKALSQAVLMPPGTERSVLLEQAAPIVKRIYQNG